MNKRLTMMMSSLEKVHIHGREGKEGPLRGGLLSCLSPEPKASGKDSS